MASITDVGEAKNKKVVLSTIWICALFNYLYADVFSLIANPVLKDMAAEMPEGLLLGWAFVMETAIAMVFLSRLLPYKQNRWANIIAGALHTATVGWTMLIGMLQPYYVFFASVEIACTLFVVWYAWTWKFQDGGPPSQLAAPVVAAKHSSPDEHLGCRAP
jgi:hypothetical protein